ncbi:hypothetical protein FKM82_019937 [Ascaphus truei]
MEPAGLPTGHRNIPRGLPRHVPVFCSLLFILFPFYMLLSNPRYIPHVASLVLSTYPSYVPFPTFPMDKRSPMDETNRCTYERNIG